MAMEACYENFLYHSTFLPQRLDVVVNGAGTKHSAYLIYVHDASRIELSEPADRSSNSSWENSEAEDN